MGRLLSITARRAMHEQQTDEVAVLLATIAHPRLSAPVYLSSDPTVRLSASPLSYGTRHNGIVFPFVWMGAVLPDDRDRASPRTTLVFTNIGGDMAAPLRSIMSPARVDLTVVLASTPDVVEAEFLKMQAVKASYDASQISLEISREPFSSLAMPFHRMTADRFPGLFP